MKVSMIGTGYVGLVSGACFAEIGHDVTCIDINERIIQSLNEGKSPIYEPGLSELIQKNYVTSHIKFTTQYDSVNDSDIIFLGVGTPSKENGEANLTYLFQAGEAIAPRLKNSAIVVIKSTVPVGTHKKLREFVVKLTDKEFYIVNNPEFLREGAAIDDFMRPDRIVIGVKEEFPRKVMQEFYRPLTSEGHPLLVMSNLSAEMAKYASNCLLATKISFINEVARLCDSAGADIEEVKAGMASDHRIGPHFINPGPGYGGSCFPKDVKALINTAKEHGLDLEVVDAVENANQKQKVYMLNKIKNYFKDDLQGKTFAFWGVSFKPKTDDVRESPALAMAQGLAAMGAKIRYFDPEGSENFTKLLVTDEKVAAASQKIDEKYACLEGADALVVMTEWGEFKVPNFSQIKENLKTDVIFDTRNIYSIEELREHNIDYFCIGRPTN